eukprot:6395026-Prymnesium_polylepis.2
MGSLAGNISVQSVFYDGIYWINAAEPTSPQLQQVQDSAPDQMLTPTFSASAARFLPFWQQK